MFQPYFETGKWIISHRTNNDLSNSGLSGRIDLRKYFENATMMEEGKLKEEVAALNNVEKNNVVITHGATEALLLVLSYLRFNNKMTYMVRLPEYEPIYKLPEILHFENAVDLLRYAGVENGYGKKDVLFDMLLYSNINNPTGWFLDELKNFRITVVDETFLQFYMDLDEVKYERSTFRINTFTKFYGGDEVRVGWILAPDPDTASKINSMKGIFTEQISRYSISVAYGILRENDKFKDFARKEMKKNLSYMKSHMSKLKYFGNREPVLSTTTFVDYSAYTNMDSVSVAEFLHSKGISTVPGKFFGIDGPFLRVCYTRENFPQVFDSFVGYMEELG